MAPNGIIIITVISFPKSTLIADLCKSAVYGGMESSTCITRCLICICKTVITVPGEVQGDLSDWFPVVNEVFTSKSASDGQTDPFLNDTFTPTFLWGTATSAYQIERTWNEDGEFRKESAASLESFSLTKNTRDVHLCLSVSEISFT